MIHEIIPLHEAGSLPGACFETYFIEESEEYKIKKDRRSSYVPAAATAIFPQERAKSWRCSTLPWAIRQWF